MTPEELARLIPPPGTAPARLFGTTPAPTLPGPSVTATAAIPTAAPMAASAPPTLSAAPATSAPAFSLPSGPIRPAADPNDRPERFQRLTQADLATVFQRPGAEPTASAAEPGDFSRGFQQTLPQLRQLTGGTLAFGGELLARAGAEGGTIANAGVKLREFGLDVFARNAQIVQGLGRDSDSFSNVLEGKGNAIDFLQFASGYTAGQAIEAIAAATFGAVVGSALAPGPGTATGAIGGLLAKAAVRKGAKELVESVFKKELAERLAKGATQDVAEAAARGAQRQLAADLAKRGARRVGGATSLAAFNLTQAGTIFPEALEVAEAEGRSLNADDIARIGATSLGVAAVESLTDLIAISKVLGGTEGAKLVRRVLVEGVSGGGREAITELVQTGLERFGAGKSLTDEEALREFVDSAAIGFVGGAQAGTVAGVRPRAATEPTPEPGAEDQPAGAGPAPSPPSANVAADPTSDRRPGDFTRAELAVLNDMLTTFAKENGGQVPTAAEVVEIVGDRFPASVLETALDAAANNAAQARAQQAAELDQAPPGTLTDAAKTIAPAQPERTIQDPLTVQTDDLFAGQIPGEGTPAPGSPLAQAATAVQDALAAQPPLAPTTEPDQTARPTQQPLNDDELASLFDRVADEEARAAAARNDPAATLAAAPTAAGPATAAIPASTTPTETRNAQAEQAAPQAQPATPAAAPVPAPPGSPAPVTPSSQASPVAPAPAQPAPAAGSREAEVARVRASTRQNTADIAALGVKAVIDQSTAANLFAEVAGVSFPIAQQEINRIAPTGSRNANAISAVQVLGAAVREFQRVNPAAAQATPAVAAPAPGAASIRPTPDPAQAAAPGAVDTVTPPPAAGAPPASGAVAVATTQTAVPGQAAAVADVAAPATLALAGQAAPAAATGPVAPTAEPAASPRAQVIAQVRTTEQAIPNLAALGIGSVIDRTTADSLFAEIANVAPLQAQARVAEIHPAPTGDNNISAAQIIGAARRDFARAQPGSTTTPPAPVAGVQPGPAQPSALDSAAAARELTVGQTDAEGRIFVGRNADGETLFEDASGVRSTVTAEGIRVFQKVALIPGRGFSPVIEARFTPADTAAAAAPTAPTPVADPQPASGQKTPQNPDEGRNAGKAARSAVVRAQRDAVTALAGDDAIQKLAAGPDAAFGPGVREKLTEWLQDQRAGADPDQTRALDALTSALPEAFIPALRTEALRLAKQAALEAARDPAVYETALDAARAAAKLTTAEVADGFKLGWDHALARKTRSTLPAGTPGVQQGFDRAKRWGQTEAGRAWVTGTRRKLENTGKELRRWFDKTTRELGTADSAASLTAAIIKATERAKLFPVELADGATPGAVALMNDIRSLVRGFRDFIGQETVMPSFAFSSTRFVLSTRRRAPKAAQQLEEWIRDTILNPDRNVRNQAREPVSVAQRRAELLAAVERYRTETRAIYDALASATTLTDLAARGQQIASADRDRYDRIVDQPKFGVEWFDTESHAFERRLKSESAERPEGSRARPLVRTKLDRITRTGLENVRNDQDVTPQAFKDRFGLADVGFGNWVAAGQDQEHLNLGFDALTDLAQVLGLAAADLGFGGELHLTIGALGHGRHAAHYSDGQPAPDGSRVRVINLTNTKGDGTVAHEWSHALDFNLSRADAETKTAFQSLITALKVGPDSESALRRRIERFLLGQSWYPHLGKRTSTLEHARFFIQNMRERDVTSSSTGTSFFREAQKLDNNASNPYWANDKELFARAAEAAVFDTLTEAGQRSDYLVSDWVAEGTVTKAAGFRGQPYPAGAGRVQINRYMRALWQSVRARDGGGFRIDTEVFYRESGLKPQRTIAQLRAEFDDATLTRMAAEARRRNTAAAREAEQRRLQAEIDAVAARVAASEQADQTPPPAVVDAAAATENDRSADAAESTAQDSGRALSETELEALFDHVEASQAEASQEQPGTDPPGTPLFEHQARIEDAAPDSQPGAGTTTDPTTRADASAERTAGELAAEAAKLGVTGLNETFKALAKVFGAGPGRLNSFPAGFDPEAFAAAKPHFQAALKAFQEAGRTLEDLFRLLLQQFGPGVRPYAIQFAKENALGAQLAPEARNAANLVTIDSDRETGDGRPRPGAASATADARNAQPGGQDAGRGDPGTVRTGVGAQQERGPGPVRQQRPADANQKDSGLPEADVRAGADRRPGVRRGPGAAEPAGSRTDRSGQAGDRAPAGGPANFVAQPGALTREGSFRDSAARNVDILKLVKALEAEGRQATPAEQALLAKYIGWGAAAIRNELFPVRAQRDIRPELVRPAWRSIAEELRDNLTPAELDTVLQSTQFAHFTSEPVVRAIWRALDRMGFQNGRIFEPGMGIGNFLTAAPAEVNRLSNYTGVEMEPISARIAKQLLPRTAVIHADFTGLNVPRDFFDLAIGNPPFSATVIRNDPEYRRNGFVLADYFFAKTIDRVRPGGLLVFVTSRGTLDKLNDKARAYLRDRADLLGAIRLPQTAFKDNAGTEVVTDVLFLRRRAPDQAPEGPAWAGVKPVQVGSGQSVLVNEYFVDNPGMVLGQHSVQGSSTTQDGYTVLPPAGSIDAAFDRAAQALPADVYRVPSPAQQAVALQQNTNRLDTDPTHRKEGGLYLTENGSLMQFREGLGHPAEQVNRLSARDTAWLRDYVPLRDAVKQAQRDQLTDGDWETSLAALNQRYDAFVKKHGQILQFTVTERTSTDADGRQTTTLSYRYKNRRLLDMDAEGALVGVLEKQTEDDQLVRGRFLEGRSLRAPSTPKIESTSDALAAVLNLRGRLDLDAIAGLATVTREQAIADLGDLIYDAPGVGWQLADEYLSGNVVAKLSEAQVAANADPRFDRNVDALLAVQPAPLGPSQITPVLGANWIPASVVTQFADEVMDANFRVTYLPASNIWRIDGSAAPRSRSGGVTARFGTSARSDAEILAAVLNSRELRVTTTVELGGGKKSTTLDPEATTAVNEKAKQLREAFSAWVWTDANRAQELLDLYNREFNNLAPRRFDGTHMTLPGLSLRFQLHPHQLRAIWRQIQTGNTYLAHAVGAGKTLEMIVGGMEQKRLGLIRKPLYVVPNHMLNQFAGEFLEAYPSANILVADEKNFEPRKRAQFAAKAALNNPDAIIVTHSAFGLLQVKNETRLAAIDQFITEILDALDEVKGERLLENQTITQLNGLLKQAGIEEVGRGKGVKLPSRLEIERTIGQARQRLLTQVSDVGKDRTVTFEDMGVDFLYIDEAHEFRKLDFATRRATTKGIDPSGSAKAMDLFVKSQYLEAQRPGRSMVMASGTPITNTMAELYTAQRFLDLRGLRQRNLAHFDAWASQFGQVSANLEQNVVGRFENVERFSPFVNVPELMAMVRQFMDVVTGPQLGQLVKRPELNTGQPQNIIVPRSAAQREFQETTLLRRVKAAKDFKPSPSEPVNRDPLINVITDGRLAALDHRFVEPAAPNDPGSKLNRMLDEIIAQFRQHQDTVFHDDTGKAEPIKGATQIVFSPIGFGEGVQKRWNSRAWVNQRLAEAGIPANEIAWMSDFKSHAKKAALFRAMNRGEIKVLIGSPKNMGTGVNVQRRLRVLHYLSPPWFPADIEQPHGRILRQGNQNELVDIFWYSTQGTYDRAQWGMVARKGGFIEQALSGDRDVRRIDDVSEVSQFEQAAALASGDDRAIQLAGLNRDIQRLERLQSAHQREQIELQRAKGTEESIVAARSRRAQQMDAAGKALGFDSVGAVNVSLKNSTRIDGKAVAAEGAQEAGQAILTRIQQAFAAFQSGQRISDQTGIATLLDGKAVLSLGTERLGDNIRAQLTLAVDEAVQEIDIESVPTLTAAGLTSRIGHAALRFGLDAADSRQRVADAQATLAKIARKLGAPFEFTGDLAEKVAEAAQLSAELAGDASDQTGVGRPVDVQAGPDPAPAPDAATDPAADPAPQPGQFSKVNAARTAGPGLGLAVDSVRAAIAPITRRWGKNAPTVQVVTDPAALPDVAKADPDFGQAEGWYDGEATVYLVASNLGSGERAVQVLAHEAVGHFAAQGHPLFARALADVKRLMEQGRGSAEIRRVFAEVEARYPNQSADVQAREAMAIMAERGIRTGILDRALAALRRLLNSLGFDARALAEPALRAMLADAARNLNRNEVGFDPGNLSASAALSRPDLSRAAELLQDLARADGFFQYPTEDALFGLTDLREIGNAIDARVTIEAVETLGAVAFGRARWSLITTDGRIATLTKTGAKLTLDLAALRSGRSRGSAIYAIASTFAHNNGWTLAGDPRGLSLPAAFRRTENMLASALRFGTTRHLEPHERQVRPQPEDGTRPLDWRPGDDAHNLRELIASSVHNGLTLMPALRNIGYNFTTRQFEDAAGRIVSDDRFTNVVQFSNTRAKSEVAQKLQKLLSRDFLPLDVDQEEAPQVGQTTAKRTALLASLVRASSGPQWRSVLTSVTRQRESTLDPGLRRISYSKLGPTNPGAVVDGIQSFIKGTDADLSIVERLRNKFEDWKPTLLGALTLRHLADIGSNVVPQIRNYVDRVTQMGTDRNLMLEESDVLAERWRVWGSRNRAAATALAELMHDTTLAGVDPSQAFQPLQFQKFGLNNVIEITPANVRAEIAVLRQQQLDRPGSSKDELIDRIKELRAKLAAEKRRQQAFPAMVARFNAMPQEAKDIYVQARDLFLKRSDQTLEALQARIEALDTTKETKRSLVARLRLEFEQNRVSGPYFPLARFGDFWIAATDPDGEFHFSMHESSGQQEKALRALRKQDFTGIKTGRKVVESRRVVAAGGGFMASLDETLRASGATEKLRDDVYQLYLRTLPELSIRKNLIHRKGTPGFASDALRAFAGNQFHAAHQIARLKHSHVLDNLLQGMKLTADALRGENRIEAVGADALVGEMARRNEWIQAPQHSAATSYASSIGFAWFLGLTPGAAIVNLTQTPIVAFPVLGSRFGWRAAANELARAMAAATKTGGNIDRTLAGEELRAYNAMRASGAIDKTLAMDLAGLAETDTAQFNPIWLKVNRGISFLFHRAEVVNREATGVAAFRLARANGVSFDAAVQYAEEIIWETHFDYSNANRARFMQPNAAKVLLMFKQYSMNITYFLWRNFYQTFKGESKQVRTEARKKLTGVLGMTALFGGGLAMPLTSIMFGVANAMAALFGDDDDDEPFDAEAEFRNFLADYFGETFGRVLATGPVTALTGADFSTRISLNDLWLRTPDRELEGKALANYYLEQAAGPFFGSIPINALRGMNLVREGEVWRGIEAMVPKFLRDGLRSLRFATEGVNTLRGDPVIEDLGVYESVLQLAGLTPARVSERYDANNAIKRYEERILNQRRRALDAYAMSVRLQDPDGMRRALEKVDRFNASFPELGIDRRTLKRSLEARQRFSERSGAGIVVNPKVEARARAQGRFAEDAEDAEP